MLTASEAEAIILDLVRPLSEKETVGLADALGRILAEVVTSNLDFPYWDNSAMDGYGVRYADVAECSPENPAILKVIEEIPAGYKPKLSISTGEAARIFTGAMLPEGADTIIIQENTKKDGDQVKIFSPPQPQEFVRHRGSFYRAGNPMLNDGIKVTPADVAILATAQCTSLSVYRRPRVAIFSTGDELVAPEQPLGEGQIVDSNQYALAGLVENSGGIPLRLGIVPDDRQKLKETIVRAIETADVVLSTGGVSVGDYDYVDQILAELGADIRIRSVAVKPGKPLTVAIFPNSCLYFGIPGNPVSALVSYWRFVAPALKKLSGLQDNWHPTFIKARSSQELRSDGKRESYLWGKLVLGDDGFYEFHLAAGSHNSANLINLSQTSGLAVIPIGEKKVEAGKWVKVMHI